MSTQPDLGYYVANFTWQDSSPDAFSVLNALSELCHTFEDFGSLPEPDPEGGHPEDIYAGNIMGSRGMLARKCFDLIEAMGGQLERKPLPKIPWMPDPTSGFARHQQRELLGLLPDDEVIKVERKLYAKLTEKADAFDRLSRKALEDRVPEGNPMLNQTELRRAPGMKLMAHVLAHHELIEPESTGARRGIERGPGA